jgi:hypothetical protein
MADFQINDQGSIVLFTPVSDEAREFATEAFANAMTFGTAYVVEHRYADDIIADLVGNQGFTVE